MLTFEAETHTYKYYDVVVPSVTQVLDGLEDLSMIPAAVLENKRQIGTAVHMASELDDLGTLDESTVDPAVVPYLDAWRLFKQEHQPEVIAIELKLFHDIHRYAGTVDRVLIMNGITTVADIKARTSLSPVVGLQLAAYEELYKQNSMAKQLLDNKTQRIAIQLMPDGKYKIKSYNDRRDIAVFLSQLKVNQWRSANGC